MTIRPRISATSLDSERTVFVAYPYTLLDRRDYRKAFKSVENAFNVKFLFADERIESKHILEKIIGYIRSTKFGIYDISGWNPNVTLELGIAFGLQRDRYILFNPTIGVRSDVPSDVQGFERIHWTSFVDLEERLSELVTQKFPVERKWQYDAQMEALRADIKKSLRGSGAGLGISSLATAIGVNNDLAKVALKPLLDSGEVSQLGSGKGTYYMIAGKRR